MNNFNTEWSREDLEAYILIYCANANFEETQNQRDFIKEHVSASNFKTIHKEFNKDNDYQSIQKIQTTIEKHGYSKDEIDELFDEMKELFLSDENYDILEQNLFRGLHHIIG